MFTRLREWLQGDIEKRAARLNPQMRRDLAAEVEANLAIDSFNHADNEELIKELNQTLDDSRALLSQLEENELFLDMRIKSYTRLMDELEARQLEDTTSTSTDLNLEENTSSSIATKERQEKQKACAQLLQGVINAHKCLLADILLQKRRVDYLERTRDDLLEKRQECKDFVETSKKLDTHQITPDSQQSPSDIEMASVT